jgi:catechol 2,3-dioxygenase-like lactoylglutathione lyase family enzyme
MDQQPPLANIITLGVSDFAREREFYRRLGWPHAFDSDTFTVFELRGALVALFGIDQLGTDARAAPEPGHGGIRSSVIVTVDGPEDVDALVRRAREAGATVTKEPTDAEFFEAAMRTSPIPKATTGRSRGPPGTTRLPRRPGAPLASRPMSNPSEPLSLSHRVACRIDRFDLAATRRGARRASPPSRTISGYPWLTSTCLICRVVSGLLRLRRFVLSRRVSCTNPCTNQIPMLQRRADMSVGRSALFEEVFVDRLVQLDHRLLPPAR